MQTHGAILADLPLGQIQQGNIKIDATIADTDQLSTVNPLVKVYSLLENSVAALD